MMTKGKAMDILNKTFQDILYEILSELEQKKVDVEQEILLSNDIEKIRSLAEELNTIDKAFEDIDHYEEVIIAKISNKDAWSACGLLCELDRAFRWLPNKGEAE